MARGKMGCDVCKSFRKSLRLLFKGIGFSFLRDDERKGKKKHTKLGRTRPIDGEARFPKAKEEETRRKRATMVTWLGWLVGWLVGPGWLVMMVCAGNSSSSSVDGSDGKTDTEGPATGT
ncbi:hypothetical protein M0804_009814 [Polistes exclamans]|nr:hypothetical protein M0804_009814 [Polistes exclamans]